MTYPVFVYGLVDPRTKKFFCVGSTFSPQKRERQYLNRSSPSIAIRTVVNSIIDSGLKLGFIVLEECNSDTRDEREWYWIQKMKAEGQPLLNKRMPVFRKQRKY